MKSNILADFFYGQDMPPAAVAPSTPEYRETLHRISDLKDALQKQLSQADYAVLERLFLEEAKMNDMVQYHTFTLGWRLGTNVILESLLD